MNAIFAVCATIERIVRWTVVAGACLFPALIVVCIVEVFARYAMNAPTIWSFDVLFTLHGSLFMLTGAYGLQKKVHVRIDVLSVRLPIRVQHATNLLAYLFLFLPAIWLLSDAGIRRTWSAYTSGEVELASAWGPVIWPIFATMSLGLVALILQTLVESVRHITGLVTGRDIDFSPVTE